MNKHTPGPLQAHVAASNWYGFEASFFEVTTEDSGIVAFVKDGRCRDTAIANTRLFAAAPDLLEFALLFLERNGADETWMTTKARAAIAKARGEA